jgi:hypothetical protein
MVGKDAEVGSPLQDVPGLAQDGSGAGEVVQGQVGTPQLQQRLDGDGGMA